MKKNAKIFIAVGVLLILIIGIAVLCIPSSEQNDEISDSDETENVDIKIISENEDDIQSISCSIEDENIVFINNDGIWNIDGIADDMASTSKVLSFISSSLSIIADSIISESASDLSEFGLDNPQICIEYLYEDGSEKRFLIGQRSPTLGTYFVSVENESTVYTISEALYENLNHTTDYYTDFNRWSINTDNITDIYMNRRDMGELHLFIKNITSKRSYNVWQISEPYNGTMNAIDDYIDENILSAISQLSFNVPAKDYTYNDSDILAHVEITASYDNGGDIEYKFDVIDRDSTAAYINYNGTVFTVDSSSVDFVFLNPFYVVSKLQAFVDIDDADSVSVESSDGKSYNIEILRNGENDYGYKVNDKEMTKTNGQRAYQAVIGITADDEYAGEQLLSEDIKIHFDGHGDAEDVDISLSSIDDLSYAVTRNNNTLFTIKKSKITEMFTEIEAALNE